MKKVLLLAMAAAACASIQAADYQALPSFYLQGFSPDGNYAVSSSPYGFVHILDRAAGKIYEFIGDGYNSEYSAGIGHCLSNTGVLVGSDTPSGSAAYCVEGVWYRLPVNDEALINLANAITPDAKVICGSLGNAAMSIDATKVMSIPCVWYLQEDGTYSAPVLLPHPDYDFTGRVPQYITATDISADGNVVVGQIRDFVGGFHEPIVYTRNADGEWSYRLIARQFVNPNKLVIPEEPVYDLENPMPQSYMTEEELDAYNTAMSEWDGNYANYPEPTDYMSAESIAAYDAAMAKYEQDLADFSDAFDNYRDMYDQALADSKVFIFNNAYVSPDGKKYLTTSEQLGGGGIWMANKRRVLVSPLDTDEPGWGEDPEEEIIPAAPFVIDIADDSYRTCYADKGFQASYIAEDYTVLGTYDFGMITRAVVLEPDAEDYVFLEDYLAGRDAAAAKWMNDNMRHDVETMDYDTWEMIVTPDVMVSGIPYGTPDLSIIGTVAENIWNYDDENYYYSYIFTLDSGVTAVEDLGAGSFKVEALAGGVLSVTGEAADVLVYNAAGQLVYTGTVAGTQATGLASGLYIVKATSASGRTVTLKAAF